MKYYMLIVVAVVLIASCSSGKVDTNMQEKKKPATEYKLTTVEKGGVATSVKLPAQLAAYEQVSIFPKVNGYVASVLVDIGSRVTKGSLLMVLQAPEMEQAVMQAKEKYARSKADFSIDRERYQRLLEASQTSGAISPLDLSTIRAKMEADSAVCNAEKANWEMQLTMMGYLRVTAPFTGVITERNVHPGALVNATAKDKPMLELKQIEKLRLQVDIPEAIAGSLRGKDTVSFYVNAFPGKKMTGTINRKSNNLDAQYRSELMEIDVDNADNTLSPGMFASLVIYSKGNRDAMTVPRSAVVTSTERKYVLVMRDGKTSKIDVTTGNESGNKVEIYGAVHEGDKIIENASDEIKETAM